MCATSMLWAGSERCEQDPWPWHSRRQHCQQLPRVDADADALVSIATGRPGAELPCRDKRGGSPHPAADSAAHADVFHLEFATCLGNSALSAETTVRLFRKSTVLCDVRDCIKISMWFGTRKSEIFWHLYARYCHD